MQNYSSLHIYSRNNTANDFSNITTFLKRPVFENAQVAIMPDYENYDGKIVGLSAKLDKKNIHKISPDIIGNDIGCGALVLKTNAKVQDVDLDKIDKYIKFALFSKQNKESLSDNLMKRVLYLKPLLGEDVFNETVDSFATLGGGNHFIELDADENDNLYMTIHSGSRKLGAAICNLYSKINAQNMENISLSLPYIDAADIANQFAKENRLSIATNILKHFNIEITDIMDCPHNYISEDNTLHKGSVDASKGKSVAILLNAKDGVILGKGKGNKQWNSSAPHGSGRRMTRSEAKKRLLLDEYKKEMEAVFSTSVSNKTIDDAPQAYNDSKDTQRKLQDTIEIEKIIRSVYNYRKK